MPIYEYECRKCGHKVEIFSRAGEDPLRDCIVCHGPIKKVFHPAGIIFKGSGFYTTDYARSSGKKEESKAKKSEKKDSTD